MNFTVEDFSTKYRVKRLPAGKPSKRCGLPIEVSEDVIEGKCGFIGEGWGDGRMIAHLLAVPRNADMNKKLASRTRILERAGLTLKVKSGYESEWYFDPSNDAHCKAAIEAVQPAQKRTVVLTEQQLIALRIRLATARAAKGQNIVPDAVSCV